MLITHKGIEFPRITITIENEEELRILWCMMNVPQKTLESDKLRYKVDGVAHGDGNKIDVLKDIGGGTISGCSYHMWKKVNEVLEDLCFGKK